MADRPSGDFGRRLKQAREHRGVSLRQISNATKIGMSALEALERNDFSRLPGGIFSRAFVRSYAVEVGLDPDETIQEFLEQLPNGSPATAYSALQHEDHEAVESERRTAAAFVRLAAVSVPLIATILYFGSTGRPVSPRIPEAVSLSGSHDVPHEGAEVPAPEATSGPVVIERLTVTIAALDDCWVAASVDGNRAIERLMRRGDQETVEVRGELLLTAGNAAALAMTVNGAPLRRLGGSGQVVRARLDLSNFREFLVNP
jgi:cytoskeletal protein RodZ